MKAARLHAYGAPLVIDEVPTPRPQTGQVVVKVSGAGFCHSDLHVMDGEIRILPKLPITLGHENAGIVAACVGSDATLALAIGTTRTLGKVTQIGLAGGSAKIRVLENSRFEVQFEVTLWGTIRELREVVALAESGRLRPTPLEFAPLERINDVYARLKRGEIDGRAVITP